MIVDVIEVSLQGLHIFFFVSVVRQTRNACHFLYKKERRRLTFFDFFDSFNLKNEHCKAFPGRGVCVVYPLCFFTFQESSRKF